MSTEQQNQISSPSGAITTLFWDIGGVVLSNGWDRQIRALAIQKFHLDAEEFNERHQLIFDIYEKGELTLDQYLDSCVFYQNRTFSKELFKNFIFEQSKLYPENYSFFVELKKKHRLKVIAVSNEGRELNSYRINKFHLNWLFDAFISSCYVKLRKPDREILQMACDISYSRLEEIIYIDDRLAFVETAKKFGLIGIHFQNLEQVQKDLNTLSFAISSKDTKQK